MTSLAIAEPRAERYSALKYAAFRITAADRFAPCRTYALDLSAKSPSTLAEAMDAALQASVLYHKETLVIRETNTETGAVSLHLYAIKRESKPTRVYRDFAYHNEHRLYAQPICVVGGEALAGEE